MLVPRPRVNLLLYYGVLAPRAAWRAEVVPRAAAAAESGDRVAESDAGVAAPSRRAAVGGPDAARL